MNQKELELYVHIPFCVKKCSYCDFLSAPATEQTKEAYMAALFAEIGGRAKDYKERIVTSIFIGGGTPSLLSGDSIRQLMEHIREGFRLAPDAEITMEVNPGTVTTEKLAAFYGAGINRLSIGMQSAQEQELKILGRIHDFDGFCQVYREAVEAGFTNINVDVMSGLPGQTLASYKDTLEKVLRLEPMPQHISAYSLIVEEGTPFAAMADRGELPLPEEDTERAMYEETIEVLAGYGFHRYEISNYALDGYECRHNVGYWIRRDYLGFGIGAASLIDNVRFQNGRNLNAYMAHPLACREEQQSLTTQEQMEETMFLGLRLIRGVSYPEFARCYGQTLEEVYGEVISRNVADGLLTVREDETGRRLMLTGRGLDVSNYVMAQFLF
ncbi:MAG TPA: oxygen-independent coproporphyrinogen III oxidase [Lachnospiraceae bacterium]|nr:oxygen-independent coproporphyrinogen III oxidase [Lachnospiraceae bacterium]